MNEQTFNDLRIACETMAEIYENEERLGDESASTGSDLMEMTEDAYEHAITARDITPEAEFKALHEACMVIVRSYEFSEDLGAISRTQFMDNFEDAFNAAEQALTPGDPEAAPAP